MWYCASLVPRLYLKKLRRVRVRVKSGKEASSAHEHTYSSMNGSIFRHKAMILPAPQARCAVTRSYPPRFLCALAATICTLQQPMYSSLCFLEVYNKYIRTQSTDMHGRQGIGRLYNLFLLGHSMCELWPGWL